MASERIDAQRVEICLEGAIRALHGQEIVGRIDYGLERPIGADAKSGVGTTAETREIRRSGNESVGSKQWRQR